MDTATTVTVVNRLTQMANDLDSGEIGQAKRCALELLSRLKDDQDPPAEIVRSAACQVFEIGKRRYSRPPRPPLDAVTVAQRIRARIGQLGGLPEIQVPICERFADKKYRVGSQIVVLQESEDHVLRSLIDLDGAANKNELASQTGKDDSPRVLKSIVAKYPMLAPHIKLPGGKGKGGYQTTIRHAER